MLPYFYRDSMFESGIINIIIISSLLLIKWIILVIIYTRIVCKSDQPSNVLSV